MNFFFCEPSFREAVRIIEIPAGIIDKSALIDAYRDAGFPEYLADNWDSLFDCLRDFSWAKSKTIQILHHDLPISSDVEGRRLYLSLLADAVADWRNDDDHQLEVVFPLSWKATVQHLLRH